MKQSKKLRKLSSEQYESLKETAKEYGVRLGGYQSNHGIVLYTSETVIYGDNIQALTLGIHRAGESRLRRVHRQTLREAKK